MDIAFWKGFLLSTSVFLGLKVYTDFKHMSLLNNERLKELERRIENQEDFQMRFYQLYTHQDRRAWTFDSDDDCSQSEDYEDDDEIDIEL